MSWLFVTSIFFISYVLSSYILWRYPHLLHKRKDIPFSARNISHRGGSGEGYENTIRAFRQSISSGSKMLEMDVRFTKDKQIVVCHDKNLLRLTGQNVEISELNYQQILPLRSTMEIDTSPGNAIQLSSWSTADRKMPLLSEVFNAFPTTLIHLDVCCSPKTSLCCEVKQLIRSNTRGHFTIWGSSEFTLCSKCIQSVEHGLPWQFFSPATVRTVTLASLVGLLPFLPIQETHYSVFLPESFSRFATRWGLHPALVWFLHYAGKLMVWKPLIQHLQRRGIHVYLWVCNSSAEFDACELIGADGIMTDYPTKLEQYFKSRAR